MADNSATTISRVGIYYTEPEQKEKAQQLADSLGLPVVRNYTGYDFVLWYVEDRLNLFTPDTAPKRQCLVCVEFVRGAAAFRRKQGKKEMLLKAIGFQKNSPASVLDVTGGLGKDSFLMATSGCQVQVVERNRIVAALLADGLLRAAAHAETRQIAQRIHLSVQDSLAYLEGIAKTRKGYDVIYLDPMFPERTKSALVKKEMQMLQKLIGPEEDTEQLFANALQVARNRVVVKRPSKAPPLTEKNPSHSLTGKTTRYDVYLTL